MPSFTNNPVYKAMHEGKLWGNIANSGTLPAAADAATETPEHAAPSLPAWAAYNPYLSKRVPELLVLASEEDYLDGFVVPDLKLRKSIWESFPVILAPLPASANGTDRYAIQWHNKHLATWKEAAEDKDQYELAEEYVEYRLLYAIAHHPKQYVLEAPRSEDEIAVLAMRHSGVRHNNNVTRRRNNAVAAANTRRRNNTVTRRRNNAAATASNIPQLTRLNEIKEHFPVIWSEVPGRAGTKTYAIQLFHKKIREQSAAAGRNLSASIQDRLLRALGASKYWVLLPPASAAEVARIEMITK